MAFSQTNEPARFMYAQGDDSVELTVGGFALANPGALLAIGQALLPAVQVATGKALPLVNIWAPGAVSVNLTTGELELTL